VFWRQRRRQPLNHFEEKEEAETLSTVLQRRKVVFGEEARKKARRSGPEMAQTAETVLKYDSKRVLSSNVCDKLKLQ
jgi:hypothetical protein